MPGPFFVTRWRRVTHYDLILLSKNNSPRNEETSRERFAQGRFLGFSFAVSDKRYLTETSERTTL